MKVPESQFVGITAELSPEQALQVISAISQNPAQGNSANVMFVSDGNATAVIVGGIQVGVFRGGIVKNGESE